MAEVGKLRSVLVDITQGRLASDFDRKMLEGSRKERSQLKVAPKAGPIAKWSTSKVKIINDRPYLRKFYRISALACLNLTCNLGPHGCLPIM